MMRATHPAWSSTVALARSAHSSKQSRKVAVVFESDGLYPDFSPTRRVGIAGQNEQVRAAPHSAQDELHQNVLNPVPDEQHRLGSEHPV